MKGLYKSTGYWQTQAAREDWSFLQWYCETKGFGELAQSLAPNSSDGWRKIDKRIDKLQKAMIDNGESLPPWPSDTSEYNDWLRLNPNWNS